MMKKKKKKKKKKNAYFILKTIFVLKVFKFLSDVLVT